MDGAKVLHLHTCGPAMLHTKKAVYRPDDLKGTKISGTGPADENAVSDECIEICGF